MTKCAVEEMATVRLCAMVSELASTDKWLGYRFYLPEAWRAREEKMCIRDSATALLLGRLLEADPNWPGFQRRLESAADAAEQWPTFAALPKGQWLPRGTHAAAHAS